MTQLRECLVEDAPGGALTLFVLADVDAALDDAIRAGRRAPYGGVLWDAAPCVAAVLAGFALRERRVVELGCGLGLVSLACARAGADVLATDVDDLAVTATRRAAAHAGLTVAAARFDVCSDEPLPPADVVVAADLLYEPALATAVAWRAREALAAGACVVIGDPGRAGRATFTEALGAAAGVVFRAVVVGVHRADVAVLGTASRLG